METHSELDDVFWTALIIGIFSILIACSYLVTFQRLKLWAKQEGVCVLKKSLRRSGDFYVEVEDREKNVFTGWVKTGGLVAALLAKKPTVIWDNRPAYLKE